MSHYDGNITPMGQRGINKNPKALTVRPPCRGVAVTETITSYQREDEENSPHVFTR